MTANIQKNVVSSVLNAAITGGVGVSISIPNSELSTFDVSRVAMASQLF